MKKQLRGNSVQRRIDGRHRRLTFERCEERLTLSGASVAPVDAASDGGFISLDAGDFLSTASNDFAGDSTGILSRFNSGTTFDSAEGQSLSLDSWIRNSEGTAADPGVITAWQLVSVGEVTPFANQPIVFVGQTIDMTGTNSVDILSVRSSLLSLVARFNDIAGEPSAEVSVETPTTDVVVNGESQSAVVETVSVQPQVEPSGAPALQTIPQIVLAQPIAERPGSVATQFQDLLQPSAATSNETTLAATTLAGETFSRNSRTDWSTDVGLSVNVNDESSPTTETAEVLATAKTPRESVVVVDAPGEIPQVDTDAPPVPLVIAADADQIDLPSQESDVAFAYSTEGGPIEVAQAVTETQRAYEAQMFSAVASLLDNENILAQPTPPVRQPFAGELARSVAFETLGLHSAADSAHFDDSQATNADISASAAAVQVNEPDSQPSRALAFAQWPLVFSATVGAVLVGTRRRSQTDAAQPPPRRNRQAVAP